ncbi:hypothetical protein Vi05172_g736 [Venturia inaequalis]|nr:hypothetical protein Vi05172_g736 [Venturia inaequalis]
MASLGSDMNSSGSTDGTATARSLPTSNSSSFNAGLMDDEDDFDDAANDTEHLDMRLQEIRANRLAIFTSNPTPQFDMGWMARRSGYPRLDHSNGLRFKLPKL